MTLSSEPLIAFRKSLGLSQEAMAKALGISRAVLGNIESRRSKLTQDHLDAITAPLSISSEQLMEGDYPDYTLETFKEDTDAAPTPDEVQEALTSFETITGAVLRQGRKLKHGPEVRKLLSTLDNAALSIGRSVYFTMKSDLSSPRVMNQAQIEKAFDMKMGPDSFEGETSVVVGRRNHVNDAGRVAQSYDLAIHVQDWDRQLNYDDIPVSEEVLAEFFKDRASGS